jgi:hypothetical protein
MDVGSVAGAILLGYLIFVIYSQLRRKKVTDAESIFDTLEAAHQYAHEQQEAGFACYISAMSDGRWHIRCYRRRTSGTDRNAAADD